MHKMRLWTGIAWIAALVLVATTLVGVTSTDEPAVHVPAPRVGDAGHVRLDSLTLEGEDLTPEGGRVTGFTILEPRSMDDTFGEPFEVFGIQFYDPDAPENRSVVGTAWSVGRQHPPLATTFAATEERSRPGLLGTSTTSAVTSDARLYSRPGVVAPGLDCLIQYPWQGSTLQGTEDLRSGRTCGAYISANRASGVTVEIVRSAESTNGSGVVQLAVQGEARESLLKLELWFLEGVPYPVETTFELAVPPSTAKNASAHDLLQRSLRPLFAWTYGAAGFDLNGSEDRDQDGLIRLKGRLVLERFDRGQGLELPDHSYVSSVERRSSDAFRLPGPYGPALPSDAFPYSLGEALDTVESDPTLTEFQAWLAEHPDRRLGHAAHNEREMTGERVEAWTLRLIGQDGEAWRVDTERTRGAQFGVRTLPTDTPAVRNTAAPLGEGYPFPQRAQNPVLSFDSAVDIWREVSGSDDEAVTFSWYPGFLTVGHGVLSGLPASDPTAPPGTMADITWDLAHFTEDDGALWSVQSTAGRFGAQPGSLAPPGLTDWGEPGEIPPAPVPALLHPLVLTTAATGALVLLMLALVKLGILPLYSRVEPHELLENPTRRRIYEAIGTEPGLRPSEIPTAAGCSRSTARYHCQRLQEGGLLQAVGGPRNRRWYQTGHGPAASLEREAVLAVGNSQAVFDAIEAAPGASLTEIAEVTGLQPSATHRVVERLVDAGLIEKRRDGRSVALEPLL